MKSIYTLFFLMVISATILPIKKAGWLIGNNAMTEDVNDHGETDVKKINIIKDDLICITPYQFSRQPIFTVNVMLNSLSDTLPLNPCYEIVDPPPDFFC